MYDDSSNGFRTVIIPMSANHPSVFHAILAVAAFYRRHDDVDYHIRALEQKENSLIHLRRSYADDTELRYEEMIAAAIMLCVFEIKDGSGPNWDKHLNGGRSILQSKVRATRQRRYSGTSSSNSDDSMETWSSGISWWANKFFGYQCVNGATAAATAVGAGGTDIRSTAILSEDDESVGGIGVSALLSPLFWLSQGFTCQEIDGFMGCSSELMAITSEMSSLAQTKQTHRHSLLLNSLHVAIQNIERRLFAHQQYCMHASPVILYEDTNLAEVIQTCLSPLHGSASVRAKMLVLTAEARRQAAFIFLYTCLKGLPVTHTTVQSRVAQALLCIKAVSMLMSAEDSPVWGMTPLIWPLFVAGAASLAEDQRIEVLELFSLLQSVKCLGVCQINEPICLLFRVRISLTMTECFPRPGCRYIGMEAARHCHFEPNGTLHVAAVSSA